MRNAKERESLATPINTMALLPSANSINFIASVVLLLLNVQKPCGASSSFVLNHLHNSSLTKTDVDLIEFPLNLEYLEAEFFLYGAFGYGLDKASPELAQGGPTPVGARKAHLDIITRDIIEQFAWQEVGHLKAIKRNVQGFPRPLLDLSAESFAETVDAAFGKALSPPFNPYASSLHYLIASYLIPYVGLTGYVGASSRLEAPTAKRLVAGLLAVESGQDAVIRALLYEHAAVKVKPYGITVAEFTNRISELRNKLGNAGLKDEGLVVPQVLGAEAKTMGNVLAGDKYSTGYARTPQQILRIVYGSGNESVPGGFFPKGANGRIAKWHLHRHMYA